MPMDREICPFLFFGLKSFKIEEKLVKKDLFRIIGKVIARHQNFV